jgi:putative hemolysin
MFTVDDLLIRYQSELTRRPLMTLPLKNILRYLLKEKHLAQFTEQFPHLQGMDFVDQILEYFNFSYTVTDRDRENIPVSGRVMIVANHPIGTLDGLTLLKLVHNSRPDVKIVANDLLNVIKPLSPFLLSVKVTTGMTVRDQIASIEKALGQEQAVIIFPAGEVSRFGPQGIRDGQWQKGFLRLACRAKAPILPIHIRGRNSLFFYATSTLFKPLSTLMLIREMFRQQDNQIRLTIGSIIPFSAYESIKIGEKEKVKLLKKHLYRIGVGRTPIFVTETAIAQPERRVILKKSIEKGDLLGCTPDGKEIYLYDSGDCPSILREISRLREVTFRAVGEGSGKRRDTDRYDRYYQHLVLWSADDLEIVGAYRFADAANVIRERGVGGLYSDSLFKFSGQNHPFLEQGLELGRSFVQQKYWGKRSLDYLWFGIGAFLSRNPQFRFLFGPVSISNSMPKMAKELLIYFYKLYFADSQATPCSRNPFCFSLPVTELAKSLSGDNFRQDLIQLKSLLQAMGTSIPTLYKQYTELCAPGGVSFLDFNIDREFNNCVDGLVVVDTWQLKPGKRSRYMQNSVLQNQSDPMVAKNILGRPLK